ncbi:hypothetical protein CSB93_4480 [Pseudomonas paraeruginosa]|uniref:Uncharacterized protein n=1 Tax=Pseudomonas paraeruginosa TaxID=2994495 RepID=A0A2R3IQL1_9PSED|nr:hypothetical protein CSB93_4480 [Pseudomonas paraeruginosa]AWE93774.1 hypothetical protein CSC28_3270 [Pseudomonas paraeruginosa]
MPGLAFTAFLLPWKALSTAARHFVCIEEGLLTTNWLSD